LGYATAKEYPPDTRHHRQLSQLQNEAQRALRGLWKATPTLVDRTLPTPIPTAHIKATPACIVAGELLYWFGEDQCCAGLSAIYITHPCDSPGDGGCKADGCFVMPPGACSVCAPCGDGVCQPEYRENPCSCAADCK
jgi:hypothetical protein